jgi:hypothetical protein
VATIGQLLDRLEIQIRDLPWASHDAVSAHATGWMPLARAGWQAITLLPLAGRSDQVKAGIRDVLAPLAQGPRKPDDEASPAPQLVELATTVGAISDSLAGILRWGPRPEHIGAPALELEADLLSALHVAARWSRAAVESQCAPSRRPPLVTFLGDLIVVSEPYALIPPQRRASTFEDLAFAAPSSSDLEGVTAGWADTAGGILADRYRVSGWAMQVIAADIALICDASLTPLASSRMGRTTEGSERTPVARLLDLAAHSWRQAAAWPPHLRLGGQNPGLRDASRALRERLSTDPIPNAVGRRVLGQALPVGVAHVGVMSDLVRNRELWVHAPFLVPKVPYEAGWIREPRWSAEGRPLMLAAAAGQVALEGALRTIACAGIPEVLRAERPRWSPLSALSPGPQPPGPTPQPNSGLQIGDPPTP